MLDGGTHVCLYGLLRQAVFLGDFGVFHPVEAAGLKHEATLLGFGLVRLIVKRLVNGLLAQPTDAIFGFVIGAAFGAALLVGWAYSGFHLEYSNLATQVAAYLR